MGQLAAGLGGAGDGDAVLMVAMAMYADMYADAVPTASMAMHADAVSMATVFMPAMLMVVLGRRGCRCTGLRSLAGHYDAFAEVTGKAGETSVN